MSCRVFGEKNQRIPRGIFVKSLFGESTERKPTLLLFKIFNISLFVSVNFTSLAFAQTADKADYSELIIIITI